MDLCNPKSHTSRSARVSQACSRCRKKKIKCDQQSPACGPCTKVKEVCVYSQGRRERRVYRKSGTRFMQLEKRLNEMESLLKIPSFALEKDMQDYFVIRRDESQVAAPMPMNDETHGLVHHNVRGENPKPEEQAAAVQNVETHAGSSLGLALKTTTATGKFSAIQDTFSPPVFMQLPPKEKAITMLQFFFTNFNNFFPIFDQSEFMEKVAEDYDGEYGENLGWWACLNVGLALACRLRSMNSVASWGEHDNASGYIENALAVAPALALQTPSLLNVQALLGMAIFLQGTPNPRSYALLVATAIRLGQNIGLHRQDAYGAHLSFAEKEQRKLVFWISYMLDKDISIRSGQPPVQNERDIDIELPGQEASKWDGVVAFPNQISPRRFFRARIQLAIIQNAIYEELHSAWAAKQSEAHRQAAVEELDNSLNTWRLLLPLDYESTSQIGSLPDEFSTLHFVIMYFTYFNCLTLVHRSSFQDVAWKAKSLGVVEPFNPYVFSSKIECIQTARTAMRLLKFVPQGNYACIWLLLNFCASAVITLLHHVYYNASLSTSVGDYKLVTPLLDLLDQLASETPDSDCDIDDQHQQGFGGNMQYKGNHTEITRIRKFCFVLRDRAREAMEVANPVEMPYWIGGDGSYRINTMS